MYYGLLSLAAKVPAAGYDSDAQAFFTAAGITDTTQKSAVNQLVLDLKSYSIWTKMKALYPFVGGTASTHKYNLKDTSLYQITWYGGVTHTSNGVETNGSTGYGDLSISPSNTSQNNASIGVYCRTEGTINGYDIGNSTGLYTILSAKNSNVFYGAINSGGQGSVSNTSAKGLFIASRLTSTTQKGYKNGSLLFTDTNSSSATETGPFFIGGIYRFGATLPFAPVDRQYAFAYVGDGLTDTEAANLYTAVQAFQTTLSRNI